MKSRLTTGIMSVLLLTSMLTLAFNVQTAEADGTETYHYSFSRFTHWIVSIGDGEPESPGPLPLVGGFDISFGPSDQNGVRNLCQKKVFTLNLSVL